MELNQSVKKRASNMVWTAAGRYDFEPLYLFFHSNNEPVLYLNTLEGLGYASMSEDILMPFLKGLDFGRKPEKFRSLAQLVLEQTVFHRHCHQRPSLISLREDYARVHLTEFLPTSRYQELGWERQALIHWQRVLHMDLSGFSKRELDLADAMEKAAILADEELVKEMKSIFRKYFYYQPLAARKSETAKFVGAGLFLVVLGQIFSGDFHIRVSDADAEGKKTFPARLYIAGKHLLSQTTAKEDRDFILHTFGPCLFPPEQMAQIQTRFCTRYHAKSSLWYAGATSPDLVFGEEQETQHKKNLAYYQKDKRYYDRSIHQITEHLKQVLEEQQEPDLVRVQSGRLNPGQVYRIPAMHDLSVFYREIIWPVPDFSVDLVLDASSSRCNEQEAIAAQAYLITASFLSLQIPVQVTSFRSIRGYTVLQSLKTYEDASADGIFHYFTAGNNRDGLAFQAIRALMERPDHPHTKRIVLILTDAMPSDSRKAWMENSLLHGKDYREELAVEDTRDAIHSLRSNGISVAAIFWGGDYAISGLRRIYGDSFIRIKQIQQFPDAVSGLLMRMLDQMHEQ